MICFERYSFFVVITIADFISQVVVSEHFYVLNEAGVFLTSHPGAFLSICLFLPLVLYPVECDILSSMRVPA